MGGRGRGRNLKVAATIRGGNPAKSALVITGTKGALGGGVFESVGLQLREVSVELAQLGRKDCVVRNLRDRLQPVEHGRDVLPERIRDVFLNRG